MLLRLKNVIFYSIKCFSIVEKQVYFYIYIPH